MPPEIQSQRQQLALGRSPIYVQVKSELHHARGKPFVFVTGHVGNWEISTAAAARMGIPLTVVYAPQSNPMIDWMVQRYRRALGCGFIAKDAGVRPPIQQLQAGRSLGMLVDQRVRSGASLPFFGETTKTTLVPARLAIKYGCPLVPVRLCLCASSMWVRPSFASPSTRRSISRKTWPTLISKRDI